MWQNSTWWPESQFEEAPQFEACQVAWEWYWQCVLGRLASTWSSSVLKHERLVVDNLIIHCRHDQRLGTNSKATLHRHKCQGPIDLFVCCNRISVFFHHVNNQYRQQASTTPGCTIQMIVLTRAQWWQCYCLGSLQRLIQSPFLNFAYLFRSSPQSVSSLPIWLLVAHEQVSYVQVYLT